MVSPGTVVTFAGIDSAAKRKPKWLTWNYSADLKGTAELPSGYTRFGAMAGGSWKDKNVSVDPVPLPADDGSEWRAIIYAPNGAYVVANGLPGAVPTIGTPRVRLTDNGPSRAVLRVPSILGAGNILAAAYAGWSDGAARAVARGMEMTVEYRQAGQLILAFRGRIYQVEAGDVIALTAYDRLMDLANSSDQYIPSTSSLISEVSMDRTDNGNSTYTYALSADVSNIVIAHPVDRLRISALTSMTYDDTWGDGTASDILIHNLPSHTDNGTTYGVAAGMRLHRLAVDIGTIGSQVLDYSDVTVTFYIYSVSGDSKTKLADWSVTQTVNFGIQKRTHSFSVDISGGYVVTNPSKTYIGISYSYTGEISAGAIYFKGVASHLTTSTYYQYSGGTWAAYSGDAPELSIDFDYIDTATDVKSSLSISGATVTLPANTAPQINTTYISTQVLESGISIQYSPMGAIALQTVVEDLIKCAGMLPNIPANLGLSSTGYYTSATYDYLTCIQELIREVDAGVRDSLTMPGTISVLPRHNTAEQPVAGFTTAPAAAGVHAITAHNLTARWMAEKATIAVLAENATTSGLPIGLETDDWLMPDSMVKALGTPLRSVTTDTSSGTHALLANKAAGQVMQLHTNVIEGNITLAGYRADLWDLDGNGEGGLPISLTVPEYGISSAVVIPTEMEIGDGVTVVTLDNIRRADRSEVANSMGLTADAIGTASTQLPDTVWIFARADRSISSGVTPLSTWELILYHDQGGSLTNGHVASQYTKFVKDAAGYWHILGVIPASGTAVAATYPIAGIRIYQTGVVSIYVPLDNPVYALANQNVHVDVRIKAA